MAQGGLHDKRKLDHTLSQQGIGGHGISGRKEVFYDGKSLIRILSDQAFV